VEVELGGCCLEEEELDDHLAQCAQLVRSGQQVQLEPLVQQGLLVSAAQQGLLVSAAQQEQVQCVQLAQAT
jgi:hypothetical protein